MALTRRRVLGTAALMMAAAVAPFPRRARAAEVVVPKGKSSSPGTPTSLHAGLTRSSMTAPPVRTIS